METWMNTSLIIQTMFYFGYEMRIFNGNHVPHLAFLFVIFMNEVTMYGGNWFGHQIITWMCFFFSIKIFAGVMETFSVRYIQQIWNIIVISEFIVMSAVPIMTILTGPTIGWFVPAFLPCVPIAFPTSNRTSLPSKVQRGVLSIAPAITVQLLTNDVPVPVQVPVPTEEEEMVVKPKPEEIETTAELKD